MKMAQKKLTLSGIVRFNKKKNFFLFLFDALNEIYPENSRRIGGRIFDNMQKEKRATESEWTAHKSGYRLLGTDFDRQIYGVQLPDISIKIV